MVEEIPARELTRRRRRLRFHVQVDALLHRDLRVALCVLADGGEGDGFRGRGRGFRRRADMRRGCCGGGGFLFAPEPEAGERGLRFLRLRGAGGGGARAGGRERVAGVVFPETVLEAVLAVAGCAADPHGRKRVDVGFAGGMGALLAGGGGGFAAGG